MSPVQILKRILKIELSTPEYISQDGVVKTVWKLPGGHLHREYGPAISFSDGRGEQYFRFGQPHREDGPALITKKHRQYHFEGCLFKEIKTDEEWKAELILIKQRTDNLTDSEQSVLK